MAKMAKKHLITLAILWIFIAGVLIQYAYAKYVSGINSNTIIGIAAWDLTINNSNIINQSDFSQSLTLIFPGDQYYNANCVVPGAVGYFDLTIDCSNVTLPFRYTVTSSFAAGNNILDMEIIGYALDGDYNNITYLNSGNPNAAHRVPANVNSSTMRVYIQWVDGGQNEALNDLADTNVAISSGRTVIQAHVSFEQLMS